MRFPLQKRKREGVMYISVYNIWGWYTRNKNYSTNNLLSHKLYNYLLGGEENSWKNSRSGSPLHFAAPYQLPLVTLPAKSKAAPHLVSGWGGPTERIYDDFVYSPNLIPIFSAAVIVRATLEITWSGTSKTATDLSVCTPSNIPLRKTPSLAPSQICIPQRYLSPS